MLNLLDMTAQKVSSTRVRELLQLLETKNSTEALVTLDRLDSHNIRIVGWILVTTIAIVHQNYDIVPSLCFQISPMVLSFILFSILNMKLKVYYNK